MVFVRSLRTRYPSGVMWPWPSLGIGISKRSSVHLRPGLVHLKISLRCLPLWDSGVRQSLKRAAVAEGCDFPGLGPHTFRRAHITWCQQVGGSSIEASKIAGHSSVRMTEHYTKIQPSRQQELTCKIQDHLANAGKPEVNAVSKSAVTRPLKLTPDSEAA